MLDLVKIRYVTFREGEYIHDMWLEMFDDQWVITNVFSQKSYGFEDCIKEEEPKHPLSGYCAAMDFTAFLLEPLNLFPDVADSVSAWQRAGDYLTADEIFGGVVGDFMAYVKTANSDTFLALYRIDENCWFDKDTNEGECEHDIAFIGILEPSQLDGIAKQVAEKE